MAVDSRATEPGLRDAFPAPAASRSFLFGYVVAQTGAFLSFLPLLQILLPLKAEAVAGGDRVQLLGAISAAGALAGGGANLLAGHFSDRSRSRFGRRRPWLVAGAGLTALSYGLIWAAHSPLALTAAVAAFQIAFNILFAPLVALTPDRVPVANRGWAAGLLALGHPLGLIIGGLVIGSLIRAEGLRFLAMALMVSVAIIPFALRLRDPQVPGAGAAGEGRGPPSPHRRNFWLGWVARALVVAALSVAQTYLLFYLQAGGRAGAPARPEQGVADLGVVFGTLNILAALAAGRLSDRLRRRRAFVIGAALALSAGLCGVALAPGWPALVAAYALFGLGAGAHTAVDFALMTELLPSRDRPARDLAILNLSNIAPQVAAPLLAGLLIDLPGADLRWIFAAGALSAGLAAGAIGLMRGVR